MAHIRLIRDYPDAPANSAGSDLRLALDDRAAALGLTAVPTTYHWLETEPEDVITTSVTGCARCGLDHERVHFTLLERPIPDPELGEFAWWAPCPSNGQPILLPRLRAA